MLIAQFVNWQFGISLIAWTDERVSLVDDKQTLNSLFWMELLQAFFSLTATSSLFKSSSSNWEDWEFGCSWAIFLTLSQELQRSRTDRESSATFEWFPVFWLIGAKFSRFWSGRAKIYFSTLISPILACKIRHKAKWNDFNVCYTVWRNTEVWLISNFLWYCYYDVQGGYKFWVCG